MQNPDSHQANPESSNKSWRYRLGLVLFFGAFPIFFATPVVVPMLGLSAGESAALIGGILLAIEVLWIASIPLLGKEGFQYGEAARLRLAQTIFQPGQPSATPIWRGPVVRQHPARRVDQSRHCCRRYICRRCR